MFRSVVAGVWLLLAGSSRALVLPPGAQCGRGALLRRWSASDEAAPPPPPQEEPKKKTFATFDEAEAYALELCAAGDYAGALPVFAAALKLPGDGFDVIRKTARNSPVGGAPVLRDLEATSFASEEQRSTTYFNLACCRANLGDDVQALDDLEQSFALGFDDFDLAKNDKDFDPIRDDVDRLIAKYKPKPFLANLLAPILNQVDIKR